MQVKSVLPLLKKTTNFLRSDKIFEATQGEGRVKDQKADTKR